MNTEVIVTRTARVSFLSEGIIRVDVMDGSEAEKEDAIENYMAVKKLGNGKKMAVLIDSRVETTATKEARSVSSGALVSEVVLARAILTHSVPVKLLGNFYIKFHKPQAPTQLFNDEKAAVIWLEKEMAKCKRAGLVSEPGKKPEY